MCACFRHFSSKCGTACVISDTDVNVGWQSPIGIPSHWDSLEKTNLPLLSSHELASRQRVSIFASPAQILFAKDILSGIVFCRMEYAYVSEFILGFTSGFALPSTS